MSWNFQNQNNNLLNISSHLISFLVWDKNQPKKIIIMLSHYQEIIIPTLTILKLRTIKYILNHQILSICLISWRKEKKFLKFLMPESKEKQKLWLNTNLEIFPENNTLKNAKKLMMKLLPNFKHSVKMFLITLNNSNCLKVVLKWLKYKKMKEKSKESLIALVITIEI